MFDCEESPKVAYTKIYSDNMGKILAAIEKIEDPIIHCDTWSKFYEELRSYLAAQDIWQTEHGYCDIGENGENLGVYVHSDGILLDLDGCDECKSGCAEWCDSVKAAHAALEGHKIVNAVEEFLENFLENLEEGE